MSKTLQTPSIRSQEGGFQSTLGFLFEPPHGFIFAGIPSQQIAQELACWTNKYTKVAECITLSSFYLACEQCRLKSQTFHSLSQKKKNEKKKKIPVRIQRKTIEPWQFVFHWRSKPSFWNVWLDLHYIFTRGSYAFLPLCKARLEGCWWDTPSSRSRSSRF